MSETKQEPNLTESLPPEAQAHTRNELQALINKETVHPAITAAIELYPDLYSQKEVRSVQVPADTDDVEAWKIRDRFVARKSLEQAYEDKSYAPEDNLITWVQQGESDKAQQFREELILDLITAEARKRLANNSLTNTIDKSFLKEDTPKRSIAAHALGIVNKGVEKFKGAIENPRTRMVTKIAVFAIGMVGHVAALRYGYMGAEQLHESLTAADTVAGQPNAVQIPDSTPIAPELPLPEPDNVPHTPGQLTPEQVQTFNIPKDGTGEGLMRSLGVDPKQWYTIASDLIREFPNEFYSFDLPNGEKDVRIAHQGPLSPEASRAILERLHSR